MSDLPPSQPESTVFVIDRLARALFTWVRHEVMQQRFDGISVSETEQCALAAGFIAGLRTRVKLDDCDAALLAYAYTLMGGERKNALELAERLLTAKAGLSFSCSGYLHGLQAARNLLRDGKTDRDSPMTNLLADPDFSIQ